MGTKGDKLTPVSQAAAEQLVSRLAKVEGISAKKMFGGHGIFHQGKMFGIVDSKGNVYFKVNDSSYKKYAEQDSHKHGKMPYYSVPVKVLENEVTLLEWAWESIEISKL
ncbi:TfoX/Sxy family protein [Flagellimonas allohymeniacidonis]|uniref:TfoX N-terminal domain-containing protein n=1 Tax=Flagellimonas allohymeniacidonis TaxID=2517819 RepID=A0A4Q8QH98_9FLAO|nr:TfoX/Sxy family protein [Allomuricauda hymeniacidonis]TAI47516.1 hypothetical protein EW142_12670 [Allomuricauda hymeniacidonis]